MPMSVAYSETPQTTSAMHALLLTASRPEVHWGGTFPNARPQQLHSFDLAWYSSATQEQDPLGSTLYILAPNWFERIQKNALQLGDLPTNWNSHRARTIPADLIHHALNSVLLSVASHQSPPPQVVPLSSGGISFEWHQSGIDLELVIRSPEDIRYFFTDGSVEEEGLFDRNRIRSILARIS